MWFYISETVYYEYPQGGETYETTYPGTWPTVNGVGWGRGVVTRYPVYKSASVLFMYLQGL